MEVFVVEKYVTAGRFVNDASTDGSFVSKLLVE
jgi:hypothetical protein